MRLRHEFWRILAGIFEALARATDQRRAALRREILARDGDGYGEGV
jgi:hypothetical protein